GIGMDKHALAQNRVFVKHRARKDRRVRADPAPVEDPYAAMNHAAFGDFNFAANERLWMNFHALGDLGRGADKRCWANPAQMRLPRRAKMRYDFGERRVDVSHADEGPVARLKRRGHDHGRRLTPRKLRRQSWMIDQRDFARPCDREG